MRQSLISVCVWEKIWFGFLSHLMPFCVQLHYERNFHASCIRFFLNSFISLIIFPCFLIENLIKLSMTESEDSSHPDVLNQFRAALPSICISVAQLAARGPHPAPDLL
jgi:hypothetical protein